MEDSHARTLQETDRNYPQSSSSMSAKLPRVPSRQRALDRPMGEAGEIVEGEQVTVIGGDHQLALHAFESEMLPLSSS